MQDDIGQVVAEGVQVPEMPLDGLRGRLDRVIFGEAARREPDFPEAARIVQQRILGEVEIVIHEPVAVQSGREDPKSGGDD